MDIQEINQSLPEFLYQMLGRLEADCLYYLGNGGRFAGHLWAGNEREQIKLMRMIYRRLCEIGAAPEWMSEQQINDSGADAGGIKVFLVVSKFPFFVCEYNRRC